MTCEDQVALDLFDWFRQRPRAQIVSFHPPSGKAYQCDLIRFPKIVNGLKTRARYHIDLIVVEDEYLFFIELKCDLSESKDDIDKLRDLTATYSLPSLLDLIERRITTGLDFSNVKYAVLALGFLKPNTPGNLPPDFVGFCTATKPPTVHFGNLLPVAVQALLS